MIVATLLIALVLASVAALHVYWAVGGRWGGAVAVPTGANGEPLFVPTPLATMGVAVALATAAALVLAVGGALPHPPIPAAIVRATAAALAAVFLLRAVGDFRYVGIFKRVRGTPFGRWDTRLFSPLCLALGIGIAALAYAAG